MFQGSGGFTGGFTGNAGGGGGFNTEQSFTSPGGSRKPAASGGNNKPSSVMPVTVALMLKAEHNKTDDIFTYEGVDIHMVSFVGVVTEVTEASTSISYKIDDHTGPAMSVRKFIQQGEEEEGEVIPKTSSYVRVFGNLRSLNDQRNVIAFAVTPVTSHNEITVHMLEVVRAQLRLKKGFGGPGGASGVGMMAGSFSNGASTNGNSVNNDSAMAGLTHAQQNVFNALKKSSSDIGMSLTEISTNVSLSVPQIRSAIEFLSNEGHIYSTVDDEHYKLTDYC